MLGALSTFIFGLLNYSNFKTNNAGIYIFLAGVFLTELLLFGQGVLIWAGMSFIPNYHLILALLSLLLPIGLALVLAKFSSKG